MLFNSFSFLFIYLPITAFGFFLLARVRQNYAAYWLAAASLFFYGCWDYRYIPLLLGSIALNFWAGRRITRATARRGGWLAFAITADLALLAYFKYADFFIYSINAAANTEIEVLGIVLPIGISFFTFTQIAFLVDCYQGKARAYNFAHYLLFVTYFPHLIAGPVLHHSEMMPQFADPKNYTARSENFAIGLTIFSIGLAKKVLIADNLAPHASFVFEQSTDPSMIIAWGGVLAYTFQVYFDFSGYSDMAIGLSRLFGVRLPLNFDSPYKAHSISDFWRRWHMTLSRFLRDYLYFPLGGNRRGPTRRCVNLLITMLLGGLWHGAGWSFVIWGGLHGVYLIVNHAWVAAVRRLNLKPKGRVWRGTAWLLTFLAVCFAWVYFRAPHLDAAHGILAGMLGFNGVGLPAAIGSALGPLRGLLEAIGMDFYLGGGMRFVQTWSLTVSAAFIAFCMPNTQQLLTRFEPAINYSDARKAESVRALLWRPTRSWAAWIGLLASLSLLSLNHPSEFLYFQF